ncbi:hypothetical protein PJIAN_3733 [Paludibacter jiangxiensis]|uniref:Uncharacterized protein n=1 Tax=Paludibacter jiangxiensis TaxID=681398 RepID=A0A161L8G0_9BACT|nr:hypothetical protein PJIAN_3733 [Paludibacter jiangxiensis]
MLKSALKAKNKYVVKDYYTIVLRYSISKLAISIYFIFQISSWVPSK